jgi:hypothetical protein
MMDTWTKQMGYPVVEVDERGDQIHVKQLRYLSTVCLVLCSGGPQRCAEDMLALYRERDREMARGLCFQFTDVDVMRFLPASNAGAFLDPDKC